MPIWNTTNRELDEDAPADAEPGLVEPDDFDTFRKCPVCGATTGQPCTALSGYVTGGRPAGGITPLARAHTTRPLRTGR